MSSTPAPRFVTFVFFSILWVLLILAIAYLGFEYEPATLTWPYLVVFLGGLVLIAVLCKAMPVDGILEDRVAAKVDRKRAPKKKMEIKWTPKARADAVIDTQIHLFGANRRSHPERDPHAWLALTLEARENWEGKQESFYYGSTSRYSVLDLTQAPVALGLFILHREDMQAASVYGRKFEDIMAPVYELIENDEFISKWRATNPWTVANHPEVAEEVMNAFKKPSK